MNYHQWYNTYVKGKPEEGHNAVAKSGDSGIISSANTKEVADVHLIAKIDREIYKCVTDDIVTDDVIITDTQIKHIMERHPADYELFS